MRPPLLVLFMVGWALAKAGPLPPCTPQQLNQYAADQLSAGFAKQRPALQKTGQSLQEMRAFAWSVFADLTRNVNGCADPIWSTWYTKQDVKEGTIQNRQRTFQILSRPSQFSPAVKDEVADDVRFNQALANRIRSGKLYSADVLTATLQKGDVTLRPFDPASIAIKAVWMVVPLAGPGALSLPVWNDQDPELSAIGPARPFKMWRECALVAHPRGQLAKSVGKKSWCKVPLGEAQDTTVLSAGEFYARELPADQRVGTVEAKKGDFVILVGLHVATAAIPEWTWSTFWWTPARYRQNPAGADRPKGLAAPWTNYAMNVTFDMDKPEATDKGPRSTFNPYLEAPMPSSDGTPVGGTASNCLTCHARAAWKAEDEDRGVILRGRKQLQQHAAEKGYYKGKLRLEFLWSLREMAVQ